MSKLKDLLEVVGDGHHLPIGGKEYHVPHVSAEVALRFSALTATAERLKAEAEANPDADADDVLSVEDREVLSDAAERDLFAESLTPEVYAEMRADGVPYEAIKLAAMYVLIYAQAGEEVAGTYWATGGKGQKPNRAQRRTATRTRTGGGRTTR